MTNYEILKQKIQQALPRLMELTDGCVFKYLPNKVIGLTFDAKIFNVSGGGQIADTGDYSDVYVDFFSYYDGAETLIIDEVENFEILGCDPMLNDVLEWVKNSSTLDIFNEHIVLNSILKKWDLSKPYLKDQSEELIDYLF